MSKETLSRRDFISGIAAGGAVATLASSAEAVESSDAVVFHSFPIVEPKPAGGRIKIVCAEKLAPEEADQIRSAGKNIDLVLLRDRSGLKDNAAEAEAILGVVDRETMLNARKLKWVQTWAAGVESLPQELMEHPCVLTNMQRVFAPVIAESALGLMLSLARGLAQISIPAFKERRWARSDVPLADLYQKTLGIVGLGGIGTETARRAHYGFSMKVLADGDGASGRRADECRPANERDAPHVQRVGLSQHEAVVLFHQRVARRPGGPGSPCQGAQRRLDPGRRPGCDNAGTSPSGPLPVELPEPGPHSAQFGERTYPPGPAHGSRRGKRPPLLARAASAERSGQGSRLLEA